MGPQNALIDETSVTELPRMEVQVDQLMEERANAKFSRTAEFKKLKTHIEERISFYQKALPDGRALTAVDAKERANLWVQANAIIGELNMIVDKYERANEVVKEAEARRNGTT